MKTLLFGASIDIHDMVRYIRGRNEGVRSWSQLWNPHLLSQLRMKLSGPSRTPSSGPIVPHCVVDVNSSPECQCYHCRVKFDDIDMFRNKYFFFSMVLEKVTLKQSREHWLRIPYGVERHVRVELKSVKIIMVFNLCFHFNSNNLFRFLHLFD